MLKQKRHNEIFEILRREGEVQIGALSRQFGVAQMTIRRDLDALAQQGQLARTHGGAVLTEHPQQPSAPKTEQPSTPKTEQSNAPKTEQSSARKKEQPVQSIKNQGKLAVARKALSLVRDGTTVFVDAGATGLMLARQISDSHNITVLTNAIPAALTLIARPFVSVIVIGGELNKGELSCRGAAAEDALARFRVDMAFIGVSAVGSRGEMFTGSVAEAGLKRGILAAAERTVVLADSSKISRQSLCRFADVHEVDAIITDDGIAPEHLSMLSEHGAHVLVAKTGEQRGALHG